MEIKNDLDALELLLPAVIFGAEGEDEGGAGDDGAGSEGAGSDSDDEGDDDEGDGEDGGHDDADDPKTKGLRTALAAERKKAAALDKKLKQKEKAEAAASLAEKSELEQEQIKAKQAEERAEKLSNGFLQRSLNDSIRDAARTLNFIDVSDAIAGVDRSALEFEQDADDPSDVNVDEDTVLAAVKALAKKKPHFVRTGTDDGEPTGSSMGGSRKKKTTSEDELKAKYSALR